MSKAKTDVKGILIEAKGLCSEGWGQGLVVFYTRCHCVVTSIMEAAHWKEAGNGALETFATANHIDKGEALDRAVIDWNDAPGITQAEVLAAFDKAIEAVG
jgi:hypothetical protein